MASGNRSLLVALGCVVAAIAAFVFWQQGLVDASPDSGPSPVGSAPTTPGKAAPEGGVAVAQPDSKGEVGTDRTRVEGEPLAREAAEAAMGTIALRGRLVPAQGGPAPADEPLEYQVLPEDAVLRLGPGTGRNMQKPSPVKVETDGRFSVRVPKGKPGLLKLLDKRVVFRREHDDSPRPDSVATKAHDSDHDLGDLVVVAAASVSGTVIAKGGKPIADATVRLQRAGGAFLELGLWLDSGEKTDAQGRFTLAGLGGRKVGMQVDAKGHVPKRLEVDLAPGEHKGGLTIELDVGLALLGRVVDDTGKPIKDASIAAQRKSLEGSVEIQTTRGGSSTKSDESGSFVLSGLDDPVVTLTASAKGYQRIRQEDVQAGANEVILKLSRCAAIEGVLVDTEGRPIAGSEIHADAEGDQASPIRFLQAEGTKTTADGKFLVENVVPGLVAVHAEGDEHRPTEVQKIEVLPGQTYTGLRLVAQRGVTVAALVLDAKGEPVEGATVEVRKPAAPGPAPGAQAGRRVVRHVSRSSHQDQDQDFTRGLLAGSEPELLGSAKTGKDGRAKVGGLPAGAVVVAASHKQYADANALPLTLPAAGTVDATLSVTRGGTVELAVIDADRAAVAGAELQVDGPLGAEHDKPRTLHTDEKGGALLERLAAGRYAARMVASAQPMNLGGAMVVMGSSEPIDESRKEFTVSEGETVKVTVVKPIMAALVGSVTDLAGPVKGAEVEVTKLDGDPQPGIPGFGAQKQGKSDASGRFKVEGLLPGKYTVSYGKKGALVKHEEVVTVLSGQREVEKNLVLHGSTVQLTVLSALDDQPVRRAKIEIKKASGDKKAPQRRQVMMVSMSITNDGLNDDTTSMTTGETAVQTDDEGKAVLKDIPPGRYEVEVEHAKHAPFKVPAFELGADTSQDLGTVKLTAGGSIAGSVKIPEGAEMFFAMVQLAPAEGKQQDWQRVPAMQGKFRKAGLAPGKYKLRAADPSQSQDPSQEKYGPEVVVEVKSGETSKVTLELPR